MGNLVSRPILQFYLKYNSELSSVFILIVLEQKEKDKSLSNQLTQIVFNHSAVVGWLALLASKFLCLLYVSYVLKLGQEDRYEVSVQCSFDLAADKIFSI